MDNSDQHLSEEYQAAYNSYCEVCFLSFSRKTPRKLDEGSQLLFCVKCKCRTHKSCYDLESNSTYISSRFREFVCDKCSSKQLSSKACIVCHKKEGVMKKIEQGQVIHIFCALTHKQIDVVSYYPQLKFKKSVDYKEAKNKCEICKKGNASDTCAMQSCGKKVHGYCVMQLFKQKQQDEEDPQCWKYYFSSGDNGSFDLSHEIVSFDWVSDEFNRILQVFESYGFAVEGKEKLKLLAYNEYKKKQIEDRDGKQIIKRGGFAYVLCDEHSSSLYCNCLNRGSGDMVLCECCFEWYHQKCVNYNPKKNSEEYTCLYCSSFYDIKKKIIQQVRNSKTENYELKFDPPKLCLMDYLWLLRVIDHRVAAGGASKMMKELIKYPLKTSKMQIVTRSQNRRKISQLTQDFIVSYLQSDQHRKLVVPKQVIDLNEEQKPITLKENIQFNQRLKDYMKYIENFSKSNNIPDFFKPVLLQLKFKEKAIEEDYHVISELLKTDKPYPQIPALKVKAEAFSFMEVLKDINTGSMIKFEDLEKAVEKTKNSSSNIPSYLLKPLIQRYQKVKNLVELVCKNIKQHKESSTATQSAVKKLKQELIYPPAIYQTFLLERKLIKDLYLLYLKEEGKPLGQALDTADKIQQLHEKPPCNPNKEISDLINNIENQKQFVNPLFPKVIEKYLKLNIVYQIKEFLSRKTIRLSTLVSLTEKYQSLSIQQNDTQVKELIDTWIHIREKWQSSITHLNHSLPQLDDVIAISTEIKHIQDIIQKLSDLPISISDKQQVVPKVGSVSNLYNLKQSLDTLMILCTQSELKKNPMTVSKLPQNIPRQNPLVKRYFQLKKQQSTLQNKFISYYGRIHQKIQSFKKDTNNSKSRKQQLKQNLHKPNLNQISDFIETLQDSKINMDDQIKELTQTINSSLEIAKKVKQFTSTKKHENIKNMDELQSVQKQINELRKKILTQSHLSLQNELTDLYHAQICIRMHKMILLASPELDKMGKLLKFAEEQGLTHLVTYKNLRAKFEVNNESTKETNQIKKQQTLLNNESRKDNSFLYTSLASLRRSLHLMRPKDCNQKNSHIDALLERNNFLRRKIQLILDKDPKKYDVEEARSTYFEALKNPFDILGLSKLQVSLQKAEKVIKRWRQHKQNENLSFSIFMDYESLFFIIEDIESARKNIDQCETATKRIQFLKKMKCNFEGLQEVEQVLESIETGSISKTSQLYYKVKAKYFQFWAQFLRLVQIEKSQLMPYVKIKSILIECYYTVQKMLKRHLKVHQFKEIISYLQGIMIKVKNAFRYGTPPTSFEGFIDLEDLKYEIQAGLTIDEQIVIMKPFEDLQRFTFSSINKYKQTTKRSRPDDFQNEDQNRYEERNSRVKLNLSSDEQSQVNTHFVNESQRQKIKEILQKNILKNKELSCLDNINEEVKAIQGKIYSNYQYDIVKYLEMSDSFEKLFIKLINLPNLSSKVGKKKFQFSFLELLIKNIHNFNDLEKKIIQKNKQLDQNVQKDQKKEEKPSQEKEETQKTKNIQEMIATGKIDDEIRRGLKKELKAIKDIKKKKKRSSRHRSRSRSRSPQANFSSQSQDNKLPSYIQQEYNNTKKQIIFKTQMEDNEKEGALMFDPQQSQNEVEEKKSYERGTVLRLKNVNIEFVLRKRDKISTKGFMFSDQDYKKIVNELVDPGFTSIPIKKQKSENQIISYLNKPSRTKYKFLVGWLQSSEESGNEAFRDLIVQANERKRIYGIQNERIKMHIMTTRQYLKINKLHQVCRKVSSQSAAQFLKMQRMMYVLQYPSEKMYELKGAYPNFTQVQGVSEIYPVQIPQIQPKMSYGMQDMSHNPPPYMMNTMNNYPMMYPPPNMPPPEEEMKPLIIQGWNTTEDSTQSMAIKNPPPSYLPPEVPYSSMSISSILSRFSPILTDQENNDDRMQDEKQEKQEIDLASNILKSLGEVDLKAQDRPQQPQNYHQNTEQRYQRYPPQPSNSNWQSGNNYPPPHQPHNPMSMQSRVQMPYNPMATNKFPPPPPQGMNMPYKNPMMQMNRGYNPHHNPMNQQQPMPFHPPPPPQQNTQNNQNQNQNQNQQGQYQQQQNIYDQYNYHRS